MCVLRVVVTIRGRCCSIAGLVAELSSFVYRFVAGAFVQFFEQGIEPERTVGGDDYHETIVHRTAVTELHVTKEPTENHFSAHENQSSEMESDFCLVNPLHDFTATDPNFTAAKLGYHVIHIEHDAHEIEDRDSDEDDIIADDICHVVISDSSAIVQPDFTPVNMEKYDDDDGEDHDAYADGIRHSAGHVRSVDG